MKFHKSLELPAPIVLMVVSSLASGSLLWGKNSSAAASQMASNCTDSQVLISGKCTTVPPSNIILPNPNQPNDQVALQEAINSAGNIPGAVIIQLEPRIYKLNCGKYSPSNSLCLSIQVNKPLKILGAYGKTQLLLSKPLIGAMMIWGARDITLQGISIDYVTPPYSQGTVQSVSLSPAGINTVTLKIDSGSYDLRDPNLIGDCPSSNLTCTYPVGEVFDRNKNSKANGIYDYISTIQQPSAVIKNPDGTWSIQSYNNLQGAQGFVSIADTVVFTPSTAHAIETYASTNVNFFQVDVRAAPGAAFFFTGVSGYLNLEKANVVLTPGSNRFLSTNYDAYHIINSRAKVSLLNSIATNNGDDFLNISTIAWKVVAISGSTIAIMPDMSQPSGTVETGDFIQIMDPAMTALRLGNGGNASITYAKSETDSNGNITTVYLTLGPSISISAVKVGDYLFNLSTSSPYSVVSGNTFGTHRGALRMRSPGGQFSNNAFMDPRAATLLYSIDQAWTEGEYLPAPSVFGNSVSGGGLRLYGPNWLFEGSY